MSNLWTEKLNWSSWLRWANIKSTKWFVTRKINHFYKEKALQTMCSARLRGLIQCMLHFCIKSTYSFRNFYPVQHLGISVISWWFLVQIPVMEFIKCVSHCNSSLLLLWKWPPVFLHDNACKNTINEECRLKDIS